MAGGLGAGKTTLLNQSSPLSAAAASCLINDFGSINVDAELITEVGGESSVWRTAASAASARI